MEGLILVRKEKGMTSHDVVNRMRRILNTKKVGHSGTLDPNVEGVLCIFVNSATKAITFMEDKTKEYRGILKLGSATTTEDSDGEVIETKPVSLPLDEGKVKEVLNSFIGESEQLPPMISSVKINGKKLYEYAREGIEVERKPRKIEITSFELVSINEDEIEFIVNCSSGTYVRTLCVDIAKKLGTVGHMKSLVRTRVGVHRIENCNTLEEIANGNYKVFTVLEALSGYDTYELNDNQLVDVKNGKKIKITNKNDMVILTKNNQAIAMYERISGDIYASKRGLW
ncbi:MAG: tRNA pseudouridine(55) synthase TruB [Erysipelotrichales bacterium]|nr:tRNA pseudouridine(55) synthase TruB [Erysipelotrichales bacterium]